MPSSPVHTTWTILPGQPCRMCQKVKDLGPFSAFGLCNEINEKMSFKMGVGFVTSLYEF